MKKVAFAGSFDPITNGHLWVVEEGLQIAEEVVLFIAHNSNKNALFSLEEKEQMIKLALIERNIADKVQVVVLKNEYAAYAAIRYNCEFAIRGIRSAADFDYEALIQQTNRDIIHGVRTLFVMPPRDLESVSSSYIKSLMGPPGWHWKIKNFVPHSVYLALIKKYIAKTINSSSGFTNEIAKTQLINTVFEEYESGRYYHNLEHIAHCYQELEWLKSNYDIDQEIYQDIVVGIATHDLIYNAKDPILSDEQLSATWIQDFLNKYNENRPEISNIVHSTEHLSGKYIITTEKEKIMNSIDLAILAQPADIYNWYTKSIRKEYSDVPEQEFYKGRKKALETLLTKELYPSSYFSHYDNLAKHNIKQEILELEKKIID